MSAAQAQENTDWLKSQQQYWEQLFQTQQAQWTDLLNQWQQNVGGANPVPGADGFQKYFTEGGRQFLEMMQTFQRAAGDNKSATEAATDWSGQMKGFFEKIVQAHDAAESYKTFIHLGESMMKAGNAWGSVFQDKRSFGPGTLNNFDPFGFFASMPGIGYSREKQEEWGKLYRLFADYQKVMKKYNASMATVGLEAAQKFQDFVANPPKDAPPLKSLKEIYVKWVDICEEIYARYAVTKEYTGLYGETVNALMAYKKQVNKMTDDMVEELNLPTRKEVDMLHERLHEVRRDNIQLKKAVALLLKDKAPAKAKAAPKAAVKPAKKGKKK